MEDKQKKSIQKLIWKTGFQQSKKRQNNQQNEKMIEVTKLLKKG